MGTRAPTDGAQTRAGSSMSPAFGEREREMYELRVTEGLTLRGLAKRYGISPERVRQLLYGYVRATTNQPIDGKAMSRAATTARRAKDLAQGRRGRASCLPHGEKGRRRKGSQKRLGCAAAA